MNKVVVRFQPGLKPTLLKHGNHDQQSHGNWASGSQTKDISEELKNYFGTTLEEYKNSKGWEEIHKRSEKARANSEGFESFPLEIIAEKQGFAGKPKVLSEEEMNKLKAQGWVTTYRGIKDYSAGGGEITKSAETLAEEFRTGSYYAGLGMSGDGIYTTTDLDSAREYATKDGVVLKIAVPPNTYMSPDSFNDAVVSHRERISSNETNFWLDDDLGVELAAKGYRASLHYRNLGKREEIPVFLIWDRSMLAVQDTNL